jgi:hypothetical protein
MNTFKSENMQGRRIAGAADLVGVNVIKLFYLLVTLKIRVQVPVQPEPMLYNFYDRNLRSFEISWSIFPWPIFPP